MILRLAGILLLAATALATLVEWHGDHGFVVAAGAAVAAFLLVVAPRLGWSRRIFLLVGLALTAAATATRPDWPAMIEAALRTSAFIAGFFTALTCLRYASSGSPAFDRCGRFLAEQPPGRRYAALTAGGHLFGLMIGYGAVSLLGMLAAGNARREPDPVIRALRTKRMLLAVQRGFVATLAWSPLAFASAISTALVPGSSWADAALPCLVSAVLLAGIGWAIDAIFKPKLTGRPPRAQPTGTWATLLPMLALLAILVVGIGGLHVLTGVRAVGVVMLLVPVIAAGWIAMQEWGRPSGKTPLAHLNGFTTELIGYKSEIVLLVMAAFIGKLGSQLISPLIAASGFDLTAVPGWLILLVLVWLVPITGFMGMNPILSVSLMAPLLPPAAEIGLTPTAIILALTSGWALGGASSPYAASTLLVGAIANVSAWRVGLDWNRLYTPVCGLALSAWVLIYASM